MNVCRYLLETGAADGADAIVTLGKTYSYGQLNRAVHQIARRLLENGFRKGSRAVLLADNSFFWVTAYLAVLQAGGTAVPVATSTDGDDISFICRVTQPQIAFTNSRYVRKFSSVDCLSSIFLEDGNPQGTILGDAYESFDQVLATASPLLDYADVNDRQDIAAIMFTSGTTGRPRGVMVSHRNIIANTDSIIQYLKLGRDDRVMVVLPFFYCYGTSLLHTHLRAAASMVLDNRFMFADKVLDRMATEHCTGFAGVPSHYQMLLRNSSLRRMSFPELRYLQQAGGSLAPQFIDELREAVPAAELFVMYGQTEATARLSYLPPDRLADKKGSIGRGIPGVRLEVLNEASDPVGPGEIGEIVAAGDNITLGYWQEPEETAVTFRDGRLHTGDLATVDEDGFIFIVDRAKDFIKCAGNRVSCKKIEEMLLGFPDLVEVAAVGVPDDLSGESVMAFAVAKQGAGSNLDERLGSFCRQHFPSYMIPKAFVFMESLPKNSAGKIARTALKRSLERA